MLTKEQCLEILELDGSASEWDIESKYSVMVKRYRNQDSDEARQKLEDIALAYNILTGRYIEPEPVNPRLEKVVAGKSLKQWQTIWHYGKWPLLIVVIILVIAISLISSIIKNEPSDYSVVVMGHFSTGNHTTDALTDYLKEQPAVTINNPDIHIIPVFFDDAALDSEDYDEESSDQLDIDNDSQDIEVSEEGFDTVPQIDAQSQYAFTMKLVTLLFSDNIDIFLSTQNAFDRYVSQGVFLDIEEVYENIQDLPQEILDKIKPVYGVIETENDEQTEGIEQGSESSDINEQAKMYGIDVSELQLFEGMDIWFGDGQIISVGVKVRDPQDTMQIIEYWIRDYARMAERAEYYEQNLPQF